MAEDKKISGLTAASALSGAELMEVVQGGVNKKTTAQDIADLGGGGVSSVNGETGAVTGFTKTTDVVGVQDLFIPASAMWPRVTSGCSVLTQYEMSTSLFNLQGLEFSSTVQQFAQFQIALPRKWNNGTLTAVFYWKPLSSGSGTCHWQINGGAYSNDDALTVAFGANYEVDDAYIAADDLHITDATPAMTLAGTPSSSDLLALQVSRNPVDASDTLDVNAVLLGVSIRITTTAAKDA